MPYSFFAKSHTQPEQDGSVPPVLVLFGFVYHVVQMFLSNVRKTGNLLGQKLPSLTPFFVFVLRVERAKPARHDTFKIPALAASTVNITVFVFILYFKHVRSTQHNYDTPVSVAVFFVLVSPLEQMTA